MNLKLKSFIENIDNRIELKVIKIQTSKQDNNTSLINNTVYDEQTRKQLRDVENLSLWNYVKEELIQPYFFTLPNTTINDFILNSIMYNNVIKFTLSRAIIIMCDRTSKYTIVLLIYAFEIMRINRYIIPCWDELINNLKKLSDALIYLNGNNKLKHDLYKIEEEKNVSSLMSIFKDLVIDYASIILSRKEQNIYNFIEDYTEFNDVYKPTLPQNLLDKILKGFPKHYPNDEPYQFELIPENLSEIEEKFQQIFKLIDVEFNNIYKINFLVR
ncbi:uncharacterized protein LOC126899823 [Daktulosphaira vitifoliae]|uniref:uncharacterized protein LOC126899823 n=1 Tax=Daktulosphaira vitifoliae TaxID=58002 RepID=UPI0021A9801B|nr:uncharacterized protein LOC126899823 [Daktulosphaira vitifoliae]